MVAEPSPQETPGETSNVPARCLQAAETQASVPWGQRRVIEASQAEAVKLTWTPAFLPLPGYLAATKNRFQAPKASQGLCTSCTCYWNILSPFPHYPFLILHVFAQALPPPGSLPDASPELNVSSGPDQVCAYAIMTLINL